eukprot:GEMP01005715.1.p1 GENE.GEMP01005715.1~~GEMP01005715.1.p1  ORF type:complete len:801 (+),score=197.65 GEMP01005715.1:352-2754(+)
MLFLVILQSCLFAPVAANWLLQCSQCVDQMMYSDEKLKSEIVDANLDLVVAQVKNLRFREFFHTENEFFNKFFTQKQFGVIAQEAQEVMPAAVAQVPERRWVTNQGVANVTKNVLLLRDSHLTMVALSAAQWLLYRLDDTKEAITRVNKELTTNRRQREEMLEQIVRAVAITEVLQKTLGVQERRMGDLEGGFVQVRTGMEEARKLLDEKIKEMNLDVKEQRQILDKVEKDLKIAFEKEANADLVEKRKAAEAEVDKAKVMHQIEEMRHKEEQNTIRLREEEERRSQEKSTALAKEKAAFEQEARAKTDLEILGAKEASETRLLELRATEEHKQLNMKLESDLKIKELEVQSQMETSRVEQEAKIREVRENEDVHARHKRLESEGMRQNTLAAIRESASVAQEWAKQFRDNPMYLGMAIGGVLVLVLGGYLAREMSTLLREQLNRRLGRPSLIRQTSRKTLLGCATRSILQKLGVMKLSGSEFDDVVMHENLKKQVMRLANATRNAKSRHMPLLHILFYGPPGTGKTMTAQRFAEYSGLEYAFMSGGDVAPLEEQAVTELHKIFDWVRKSRKGVLLFIDEADAFLASRTRTMSETMRNALTTMLYHTGTSSCQFMMVLATNRPGDLDSAILDRIDESVEFGLPDPLERETLVSMYFDKFVSKPLHIPLQERAPPIRPTLPRVKEEDTAAADQMDRDVDVASLKRASLSLRGFSGREISKLFASLQTHILYASNKKNIRLTQCVLHKVVEEKVAEHKRAIEFLATGYKYVSQEVSRPPTPVTMNGIVTLNNNNNVLAHRKC